MMKKLLIAFALLTLGLGLYVTSFYIAHKPHPGWLFNLFALAAIIFTGLLVYYFLRRRG